MSFRKVIDNQFCDAEDTSSIPPSHKVEHRKILNYVEIGDIFGRDDDGGGDGRGPTEVEEEEEIERDLDGEVIVDRNKRRVRLEEEEEQVEEQAEIDVEDEKEVQEADEMEVDSDDDADEGDEKEDDVDLDKELEEEMRRAEELAKDSEDENDDDGDVTTNTHVIGDANREDRGKKEAKLSHDYLGGKKSIANSTSDVWSEEEEDREELLSLSKKPTSSSTTTTKMRMYADEEGEKKKLTEDSKDKRKSKGGGGAVAAGDFKKMLQVEKKRQNAPDFADIDPAKIVITMDNEEDEDVEGSEVSFDRRSTPPPPPAPQNGLRKRKRDAVAEEKTPKEVSKLAAVAYSEEEEEEDVDDSRGSRVVERVVEKSDTKDKNHPRRRSRRRRRKSSTSSSSSASTDTSSSDSDSNASSSNSDASPHSKKSKTIPAAAERKKLVPIFSNRTQVVKRSFEDVSSETRSKLALVQRSESPGIVISKPFGEAGLVRQRPLGGGDEDEDRLLSATTVSISQRLKTSKKFQQQQQQQPRSFRGVFDGLKQRVESVDDDDVNDEEEEEEEEVRIEYDELDDVDAADDPNIGPQRSRKKSTPLTRFDVLARMSSSSSRDFDTSIRNITSGGGFDRRRLTLGTPNVDDDDDDDDNNDDNNDDDDDDEPKRAKAPKVVKPLMELYHAPQRRTEQQRTIDKKEFVQNSTDEIRHVRSQSTARQSTSAKAAASSSLPRPSNSREALKRRLGVAISTAGTAGGRGVALVANSDGDDRYTDDDDDDGGDDDGEDDDCVNGGGSVAEGPAIKKFAEKDLRARLGAKSASSKTTSVRRGMRADVESAPAQARLGLIRQRLDTTRRDTYAKFDRVEKDLSLAYAVAQSRGKLRSDR